MHEDTKTEQVSQIYSQKGVNTSNMTQRLGIVLGGSLIVIVFSRKI